jgi:hypothetical protein
MRGSTEDAPKNAGEGEGGATAAGALLAIFS